LTQSGRRDTIREMPRTVLVTEGDSPLGTALARLLGARGHSVVKIVAGGSAGENGSARAPTVPPVIPWNRRSPVSSRTVLLNVLNTFEAIDDVLILEPPCAKHPTLHDTSSVEIERAFDDAKGPVFMAREALAYFLGRHSGVLCMVSMGPAASPLESGVRECFRGLCSALLAANAEPGLVVNGFQSGGVEGEEYASFIDRTLEEKARKISGRWFSCQPKGGFFQGMMPKKASIQ
jgi:NAD(P)-dependent dehydrogenase (short-subunit alcohol dehydrogenase family)